MSPKSLPYQLVDAFATGPFTGNQAGVLILSEAIPDSLQQKIAAEFNLAETAYVLPLPDRGVGHFSLRWFTPVAEERLCGHATLASTYVLVQKNIAPSDDGLYHFHTRWSGELRARAREGGLIELDFPADDLVPLEGEDRKRVEAAVIKAVDEGTPAIVEDVWKGNLDVIVAVQPKDGVHLKDIKINIDALNGLSPRGTVLTAVLDAGNVSTDAPQVHSRALFPSLGIGEDTVTGSAHCSLAIVHSPMFGGAGTEVRCGQGYGPKRTGALRVVWDGKPGKEGGRVALRGNAFIVAEGNLFV